MTIDRSVLRWADPKNLERLARALRERRQEIAARAGGYRNTPPKRRSGLVKLRPGPIVQRPEVECDVCPVPVGEGGAW